MHAFKSSHYFFRYAHRRMLRPTQHCFRICQEYGIRMIYYKRSRIAVNVRSTFIRKTTTIDHISHSRRPSIYSDYLNYHRMFVYNRGLI